MTSYSYVTRATATNQGYLQSCGLEGWAIVFVFDRVVQLIDSLRQPKAVRVTNSENSGKTTGQ